MKIQIDYNCNILYSSPYIEYLRKNYRVTFSKHPFDSICPKDHLLLFTVKDKDSTYNLAIDFSDSPPINENAYSWCHLYGKINYNILKSKYTDTGKLVKIAPSFGVKLWGKYKSALHIGINYLRFRPGEGIKPLLANYITQKNRLPLASYNPGLSDRRYIFFLSTLWNSENHCWEETEANHFRANFIKACNKIGDIEFEGGFAPNSNAGIYSNLMAKRRISIVDYIDKISRSSCVFNTPAVFGCHGWKLGEYLAMGKAIISTPIINDLPVPLEHGINIHIVSGEEEEIKDAIGKICSDDLYRNKLESGAYQYWLNYGHPMNAIRALFNPLGIINAC
jgi:glycosyltransferase involved in cell wall biosynthesis